MPPPKPDPLRCHTSTVAHLGARSGCDVPAMLLGVMKGVQKLAIEPTGSSEFVFQVRKLTLLGGACDWLLVDKRNMLRMP